MLSKNHCLVQVGHFEEVRGQLLLGKLSFVAAAGPWVAGRGIEVLQETENCLLILDEFDTHPGGLSALHVQQVVKDGRVVGQDMPVGHF